MRFYRANSKIFGNIALLLFGVCIGVGGHLIFLHVHKVAPIMEQLREGTTNYRLINPLLTCTAPGGYQGKKYVELQDKLTGIINDEKNNGNATNISVYFHEIPGGRWVGIDETHQYDPASLLKIVLMITYYKEAEEHPNILEQKYSYTKSINEIGDEIAFASSTVLRVGASYSVKDLMKAMIADSDNGAAFTLLNHVNQATLAQVYKDLNIPSPDSINGNYTISPEQYLLFFRILYNATYLSRGYSEQALNMLSRTAYTSGLVSGTATSTVVAHKYGEHINSDANGNIASVELHDCGIVYGPHLPYLLCVMTTGTSADTLAGVIQHISKVVYQSVSVVSR